MRDSEPHRIITEGTGFNDDMMSRNIYARSKAEYEAQLMTLYKEQGLLPFIARPGIVVGQGETLQHWEVGRWNSAGAAQIWGNGRNILPFVIDDTEDAGTEHKR